LIAGDSRSEYFGEAGASTSGLRELQLMSKLSAAFLCCNTVNMGLHFKEQQLEDARSADKTKVHDVFPRAPKEKK